MRQGRSLFVFNILSMFALVACGGGNSSSASSQVSSKPITSLQSSSVLVEVSSSVTSSASASSQSQSSASAAVRVNASGNYFSTNAAPIFNESFGGVAVEDQSCREVNSTRISEIFDNDLQKYVFSFHIEMEDIDCATGESDRQRLEVKTYNLSSDNLKGAQGETHFYRWKLQLPEGFGVSTSFSHIFQIKPVGGEDAMPLISFTARKANPNRLEVLYAATSEAQRIAEIPLSQLLGKWVDVQVIAHYASVGSFEITINEIPSNTQLLHLVNNALDMWREGTEFNRPKWGIYRSLDNKQDLKAETLLYDDFCIGEMANTCW